METIRAWFKNYVFPVVVMVGGIMGVGIFSLPYIAYSAGLWVTLGYLAALTAVVIFIDLVVVKVALKTPDHKRIPGFVGYHLGKWPKAISLFTSTFGGFGVLLVYLIISGEFLGNYLPYTLVYFLLACAFIFADVKAISRLELFTLALLIFSLAAIFIKGSSAWHLNNLFVSDFGFRASNLFLPYGPIIFSLWGAGMIPEIEEMLKGRKSNLKKIVIFSVLLIAVIYFIFIVLTLGITGRLTTDSALAGLKNILAGWVPALALFAGVLMTFNAFISLGLIMKKVFMYDLGIKKSHATVIVCTVPLMLFLLGLRQFIPIISLIGGVLVGIDGILLLLMHKKLGGKLYAIIPLLFVFLAGAVYEIIYFIK